MAHEPRGLKQANAPLSRVGAIIDDLFILLARCTLLHLPLALHLFGQIATTALFQPWIIYLPPIHYPSMPPWNHAFAPLFAADPGLYITGPGQAAPAFHFEKSARFPFHYKQLLLNIFIRRLIILCPSSFLGLDDIILIQRGRIAFRRYRRKFLLAISRRVRLFDSMDIDFYLKIEPYNFGYEIKKKII